MTQHTDLIERLAADALEAQAREIAELKAQESELCTLYGLAQAECKKLRKDAERYQWLRDCAALGTKHDPAVMIGGPADCCDFAFGPDLDAAIDEAMKGQP